MNLYQEMLAILDRQYRLGPNYATSKEHVRALAQATEERLNTLEKQINKSKGGQS